MSINETRLAEGGMQNWNTANLAYKLNIPDGGTFKFTGTDNVTVNKTKNYKVMDNIQSHNSGYNKLPMRITWSVTVKGNSVDSNILSGLLDSDKIFDFEYYNIMTNPTDLNEFKIGREMLVNCILESSTLSMQADGIAMFTFNGLALGYTVARNPQIDSDWFKRDSVTVVMGDGMEKITQAELESADGKGLTDPAFTWV